MSMACLGGGQEVCPGTMSRQAQSTAPEPPPAAPSFSDFPPPRTPVPTHALRSAPCSYAQRSHSTKCRAGANFNNVSKRRRSAQTAPGAGERTEGSLCRPTKPSLCSAEPPRARRPLLQIHADTRYCLPPEYHSRGTRAGRSRSPHPARSRPAPLTPAEALPRPCAAPPAPCAADGVGAAPPALPAAGLGWAEPGRAVPGSPRVEKLREAAARGLRGRCAAAARRGAEPPSVRRWRKHRAKLHPLAACDGGAAAPGRFGAQEVGFHIFITENGSGNHCCCAFSAWVSRSFTHLSRSPPWWLSRFSDHIWFSLSL